jgi:OmpA-OmpF porin, OOP family
MNSKIGILALLSALSSPAMAANFYAAVDVGQARAGDMCNGDNFGGTTNCSTGSTAYRVGGGYQFTPNYGIELSYADLGNINPVSAPAFGYYQNNYATTVQAAVTGKLPVGQGFFLIGKLGVAHTEFDESWVNNAGHFSAKSRDDKAAYGIGAQYDFRNRFAVRVQYEDFGVVGTPVVGQTGTGISRVTLLSAGVIYNF